jgi:uncharacterized protein YbcI
MSEIKTEAAPSQQPTGDEVPDRAASARGRTLTEVCNAIVQIHKQFYGKGPTKARAHLSRDLLAVVLEGGFTRGEQTLNERGHGREVLHARLAMREAVQEEFRQAIERILGRSIRSFMSANDPTAGLQAEIFVLHPDHLESPPEDGPAQVSDFAESGALSGDAAEELAERASWRRELHHAVLEEHRALRAEQEQTRKAVREERERHDEQR